MLPSSDYFFCDLTRLGICAGIRQVSDYFGEVHSSGHRKLQTAFNGGLEQQTGCFGFHWRHFINHAACC